MTKHLTKDELFDQLSTQIANNLINQAWKDFKDWVFKHYKQNYNLTEENKELKSLKSNTSLRLKMHCALIAIGVLMAAAYVELMKFFDHNAFPRTEDRLAEVGLMAEEKLGIIGHQHAHPIKDHANNYDTTVQHSEYTAHILTALLAVGFAWLIYLNQRIKKQNNNQITEVLNNAVDANLSEKETRELINHYNKPNSRELLNTYKNALDHAIISKLGIYGMRNCKDSNGEYLLENLAREYIREKHISNLSSKEQDQWLDTKAQPQMGF